jgi:hypothetical protein
MELLKVHDFDADAPGRFDEAGNLTDRRGDDFGMLRRAPIYRPAFRAEIVLHVVNRNARVLGMSQLGQAQRLLIRIHRTSK